MSPSVCAQEKSHVVISHVPSQDKRSWSLWNVATGITYRLVVFLVRQCASGWPHFRPPFFLRNNGSCGEKSAALRGSWVSGEEEARRSNGHGPMCTRREIMAKGTWRGRRRFFAALLLPTCANCTRNWISLSSWVPLARWRQCWARPQSGLSLSTERYIRLVRYLANKLPKLSYWWCSIRYVRSLENRRNVSQLISDLRQHSDRKKRLK